MRRNYTNFKRIVKWPKKSWSSNQLSFTCFSSNFKNKITFIMSREVTKINFKFLLLSFQNKMDEKAANVDSYGSTSNKEVIPPGLPASIEEELNDLVNHPLMVRLLCCLVPICLLYSSLKWMFDVLFQLQTLCAINDGNMHTTVRQMLQRLMNITWAQTYSFRGSEPINRFEDTKSNDQIKGNLPLKLCLYIYPL